MTIDGDELWDSLRSLDDPDHLEITAGYDQVAARGQFGQLVDRLDAANSCTCQQSGSPSLRT
jgi:hypothetical protein